MANRPSDDYKKENNNQTISSEFLRCILSKSDKLFMIRNAHTPGLFLLEVIRIYTCSWGYLLNKTTTTTIMTTTTTTTKLLHGEKGRSKKKDFEITSYNIVCRGELLALL